MRKHPRIPVPGGKDDLHGHLANDPAGAALLARLEKEIPIKENPRGIPSLWHMPLVRGENWFIRRV